MSDSPAPTRNLNNPDTTSEEDKHERGLKPYLFKFGVLDLFILYNVKLVSLIQDIAAILALEPWSANQIVSDYIDRKAFNPNTGLIIKSFVQFNIVLITIIYLFLFFFSYEFRSWLTWFRFALGLSLEETMPRLYSGEMP